MFSRLLANLIDVSCHFSFCCAVDVTGVTTCWANTDPKSQPPASLRAVAVRVSDSMACALTTSANILCWGPKYAARLRDDFQWLCLCCSPYPVFPETQDYTAHFGIRQQYVCVLRVNGTNQLRAFIST